VIEVGDLRSDAVAAYEPAGSLPSGATSLHGSGVPFGSAEFAARDASDIAPASLQPPAEPIPGWRASGSLWPAERFVVRVPKGWNGSLVIAGTPAQRSEFACDRLLSDPLLARGYAYACGNKGQGDGTVLLERNAVFTLDGIALPRFRLPDGRSISFWQHGRGHTIEQWLDEFLALTEAARLIVAEIRGRPPERVFAVGLSNGGYQVRRALEESDAYAGGLTWNAVLWTPAHNALVQLPAAIAAMEAGKPELVEALGFPPDVPAASGTGSLYGKNLAAYWYVTAWLHAMHLDPETSIAYGDVSGPAAAEAWNGKMAAWHFERSPLIAERVARFSNTGHIRSKLIEVASEYDHLITPSRHHEPYKALVAHAGKSSLYRSSVLANAQHVAAWSEDVEYPRMRVGHADVMAAFDDLVRWTTEAA
jgi:hypothetical protein